MDKKERARIEKVAKESGLEASEVMLIEAYCDVTGEELEYTREVLEDAQDLLVMEFWNENIDDPSLDELARDFVENDGFGEPVPEVVKPLLDYDAVGEWLNVTYTIRGRYIFSN